MGKVGDPESLESAMTLADLEGLRSFYYIPREFGLTLALAVIGFVFLRWVVLEFMRRPLRLAFVFSFIPS